MSSTEVKRCISCPKSVGTPNKPVSVLLVVEEAVGVLAARVDDVAADDALLAEVAVALESVQQYHFGSLFAFRQGNRPESVIANCRQWE